VTSVEKERWHYWNGDKVLELSHFYIEYRPTETHQHFMLRYVTLSPYAAAAVSTDLREWDWTAERSTAVNAAAGDAYSNKCDRLCPSAASASR